MIPRQLTRSQALCIMAATASEGTRPQSHSYRTIDSLVRAGYLERRFRDPISKVNINALRVMVYVATAAGRERLAAVSKVTDRKVIPKRVELLAVCKQLKRALVAIGAQAPHEHHMQIAEALEAAKDIKV